jgi:hypothetical protein
VLIGGITSASREAIRPIIDRTTTPYFHTNQYDGTMRSPTHTAERRCRDIFFVAV